MSTIFKDLPILYKEGFGFGSTYEEVLQSSTKLFFKTRRIVEDTL